MRRINEKKIVWGRERPIYHLGMHWDPQKAFCILDKLSRNMQDTLYLVLTQPTKVKGWAII